VIAIRVSASLMTRRGPGIAFEVAAMTVMTGFVDRIEELALKNDAFRHVIYTAPHSQVVLMCLEPSQEIGLETHGDIDQFFRIEQGSGKVIVAGEVHPVVRGDAVVVPAGTPHNVINTSATQRLRLSTIYSPPAHKDGVIHASKVDALRDEVDHL
jgi:mannose-6-phosphate isomerase-like protein (cupin superfamily)